MSLNISVWEPVNDTKSEVHPLKLTLNLPMREEYNNLWSTPLHNPLSAGFPIVSSHIVPELGSYNTATVINMHTESKKS